MGRLHKKRDFCKGVQPQPFIPLEIVDPIFKTWIALKKCAFYKLLKKISTSQVSTTLFPSRRIANFIKKSSVLKHHISMVSPQILCRSKRYFIIIITNNSHI